MGMAVFQRICRSIVEVVYLTLLIQTSISSLSSGRHIFVVSWRARQPEQCEDKPLYLPQTGRMVCPRTVAFDGTSDMWRNRRHDVVLHFESEDTGH